MVLQAALFLSDQEEVRQSVDSLDTPDEDSLQAGSDAPDGNIDEHEEHEVNLIFLYNS